MIKYTADGFPYDDNTEEGNQLDWVDNTNHAMTAQAPAPDDPFAMAAARLKAAVQRGNPLPIEDDRYKLFGPENKEHPSYIVEPDLFETQSQQMALPADMMQDDSGRFYYKDNPDKTIPMIKRPGVLPLINTPEGIKFATPKMLDIVGNVMGNVGGVVSVPAKAGEMILGSGLVKASKNIPWEVKGFEDANWFHGTTHEFDKFSKAKGNPENHLGQYPHFTSNAEDASANYAGIGPDLTGRIERRTDDIMSEKGWDADKFNSDEYKSNYFKAKEIATNELKGHEGAIIPAKMKLQNPASLVDNKPTWLDFTPKYDKNGEWIKDAPLMDKLHKSFIKQGQKYNFDGQKAFDEVIEKSNAYDGEIKASDLNKAMRNADSLMYVDNEKGNLISSHVISDIFKDLGFDGIVMNAKEAFPHMKNIPEGTLHAVPLKQNTVKGKYNDKILYSDTRNQVASQVSHQIEKNGFYSQLERAVTDAKMNKGDANQWLGYLKNQPGVKTEEINTVLKDLPEGPITKDQLQNIVNQNKVELNEVVKGGDPEKIAENYYNSMPNNSVKWEDLPEKTKDVFRSKALYSKTKYHDYQLPGGENYREMLLTLPQKDKKYAYDAFNPKTQQAKQFVSRKEAEEFANKDKTGNTVVSEIEIGEPDYKSSHWDEPNIIAHVRMNDRMIDGKKTLHLEEIQSDWHQAGRKQGYKLSDKQKGELENIDEKLMNGLSESDIGNPDIDAVLKTAVDKKVLTPDEAKNYKEYSKGENSNIPDAPFKKNWDDLALKRMIRQAAENGYEGISWTPGEAQAARYDLSKQISKITYNAPKSKLADKYGTVLKAYNHNGEEVINKAATPEQLPDLIGKEAAEKLLKTEATKDKHELSGLDLKVGGEGMKAFYDKMLVDRANALGKKYGAKVEQKEIKAAPKYEIKNPILNKKGEEVVSVYKDGVFQADMEKSEAASYISKKEKSDKPSIVHYLPLTPELKNKALKEGFPLFSSTPILTPVSHNPFDTDRKKYKLKKVDHNPFAQ